MNKTNTFKKLPGVLAFKRCHVVSDGLMYNQMENGDETPVEVVRHGIRGTQNVTGDVNKDVSNIQITETAKLDIQASSLIVRFNLAFLPIGDTINSCMGKDKNESNAVRESIEQFLERAKRSEGLNEVARRYARNIANGRWLWRNRTIASKIRITIYYEDDQNEMARFLEALSLPINNFDNYSPDEIKLGGEIADQMRGESFKGLTIEANISLRVPGSEVFPSQNYIEDKPRGFARPLYKVGHPSVADKMDIRVMGQAAIRDQKVFNAIRTIDTWYPDFSEVGFPIPVEPKGANLRMQEFYRTKNSSFDLFKRLNQIDPDSGDGMFCIASFDRGGVYSESDKAEKEKKAKEEDEGEEDD